MAPDSQSICLLSDAPKEFSLFHEEIPKIIKQRHYDKKNKKPLFIDHLKNWTTLAPCSLLMPFKTRMYFVRTAVFGQTLFIDFFAVGKLHIIQTYIYPNCWAGPPLHHHVPPPRPSDKCRWYPITTILTTNRKLKVWDKNRYLLMAL